MVRDVSTPELARAAGLTERPGFDLLSIRPHPLTPSPPSGEGVAGRPGVRFVEGVTKAGGMEERAIEVKGRAGIGDIELTENEWAKACNLRERYWLYVVYDCVSPHPRLLRVQDPFAALLVRARGGVVIDEREVFSVAEAEER